MSRRYSVICDDDQARRIDQLAREYDLTEEAVIRQLLECGLSDLERDAPEL